jgi:hypothetical protein
MKQKLIEVLERFTPGAVYLQGTFSPDEEYPEAFTTFWADYTDDISHYDDATHAVAWGFSVIFYSSDPVKVNTIPFQIAAALRAAGFIPQGKGFDIPSDVPSHTGWAMDFLIREIQ